MPAVSIPGLTQGGGYTRDHRRVRPKPLVADRAVALIMAMNNGYRRIVKLADDDYANRPARLRTNVVG